MQSTLCNATYFAATKEVFKHYEFNGSNVKSHLKSVTWMNVSLNDAKMRQTPKTRVPDPLKLVEQIFFVQDNGQNLTYLQLPVDLIEHSLALQAACPFWEPCCLEGV